MNKITLKGKTELGKINKHIYGHFAEHLGGCIYDGIWVGEDSDIPNVRGIRTDIVEAMKAINAPNLRWPGGCFADVYHWRDGIGPKDQRPLTINSHWGNAPETNAFGTHEFMDLCEQIGCDPYIGGNVGSGTVQEMRDWVEYITSDYPGTLSALRRENGREKSWPMPFWGIGNENWGCGGHMVPEFYADLYRQFHTHVKNYGDTPMMKIASGYGGSDTDGEDIAVVMDRLYNSRFKVRTDGVSIHYYVYLRHDETQSATEFSKDQWFETMKLAHHIDHVIETNDAVLSKYDPDKKIWLIIDEWGNWFVVEKGHNPGFLYQQNTVRDAVVAAHTLHIFQDHNDRVQMANIAQTVNVLQAMILTEGEKMLLTPTYHVFGMLKGHQDATRLALDVETDAYSDGETTLPAYSASASRSASGDVLLSLCNLKPDEALTITCDLQDLNVATVEGLVLGGGAMNAHNTFDEPEHVVPTEFAGAILAGQSLKIDLPAGAVVALTLS
ncbi:MAG: alpha-N-arabinofuranosidase [Anaerolineae bacterium]|nr:alpha-N-arabinofuranosidase [Anaerolineae bacterium]